MAGNYDGQPFTIFSTPANFLINLFLEALSSPSNSSISSSIGVSKQEASVHRATLRPDAVSQERAFRSSSGLGEPRVCPMTVPARPPPRSVMGFYPM